MRLPTWKSQIKFLFEEKKTINESKIYSASHQYHNRGIFVKKRISIGEIIYNRFSRITFETAPALVETCSFLYIFLR